MHVLSKAELIISSIFFHCLPGICVCRALVMELQTRKVEAEQGLTEDTSLGDRTSRHYKLSALNTQIYLASMHFPASVPEIDKWNQKTTLITHSVAVTMPIVYLWAWSDVVSPIPGKVIITKSFLASVRSEQRAACKDLSVHPFLPWPGVLEVFWLWRPTLLSPLNRA